MGKLNGKVAVVTGRVTYSQQILKELGWIEAGKGAGTGGQQPASGFSRK